MRSAYFNPLVEKGHLCPRPGGQVRFLNNQNINRLQAARLPPHRDCGEPENSAPTPKKLRAG